MHFATRLSKGKKPRLTAVLSGHLICELNGQVMQDADTGDMIFPVAELISFLSTGATLLPGTVILTGTPSGVGFTRKPPVYLMPGDTVNVTLEGIGTLSNSVELQE